jgi:hypothetical protein
VINPDGVQAILNIARAKLEAEEFARTSSLYRFHRELKAEQGFAVAGPRTHQQQVARDQSTEQFGGRRLCRQSSGKQAPAFVAFLPGDLIKRPDKRHLFLT